MVDLRLRTPIPQVGDPSSSRHDINAASGKTYRYAIALQISLTQVPPESGTVSGGSASSFRNHGSLSRLPAPATTAASNSGASAPTEIQIAAPGWRAAISAQGSSHARFTSITASVTRSW